MEGDAGADPVISTGDEDQQSAGTATGEGTAEPAATESADAASAAPADAQPAGSRLGGNWVIGVCVVLVLLAAGLGAAGYLGLRYRAESRAIARGNAEAVAAAKDCVLATQAPDVTDATAAEEKIISCAAGEFRTQAMLWSEVVVQASRAAKVHVTLTEMRAAVERDNEDGSVDVLVAFRVTVDNVDAQGREVGYRLRAEMVREDGQYRIAKLDQVAK